ncbi:MAG: AarF/ABC1/UbiB kinase family protein [Polyangiaceae bacterium]|jgi:ubiquinone biosynthesis protein|nr:AarF/ABC1/UbiB kinase family protein [Polyangiaceae bacterium]
MFSIVNAARDLSRLREIYVVLVRHGFGEVVSRLRHPRPRDAHEQGVGGVGDTVSPPSDRDFIPDEEKTRGEDERRCMSLAERLRMVAQDLGPTFVKLGQLLSTRGDVIPADIVTELKKLQDDVAPVSFAEVRTQIEQSLGASVYEVFVSIEERPLAAASIGQVHRAALRTEGGLVPVVVKVQRPGVAQVVARDLDLLHGLARLVERTIPESRIYSPRALVDQFDRAITSELDFRGEADNARRFAQNFAEQPSVVFPCVYREVSGKFVLTLEYLEGRKIYDAIKAGFSPAAIAHQAIGVVIKQIMEDGFFHADPHPGNIVVLGTPDAPRFGMFDLGMVGRLSAEMRDKTLDLMVAAVRRDYLGIADAMYAIGTPTRRVDVRAYRADVSELADKYLGRQLGEIELSSLVRDIIRGATKHGLEVPPDFLLVAKALMTIEGVAKEVHPQLDVFSEARPYFLDLLRKRYSPQRIGNELWRGLEKISSVVYELPSQLGDVLEDLRLGRLRLQVDIPVFSRVVDRLGRRLFAGLVVATFVLSGTWLIALGRHVVLGLALLAVGIVSLVGHVVLDLRRS